MERKEGKREKGNVELSTLNAQQRNVELSTLNAQLPAENGEWRMENGEWRMENGEWRVGGAGRRVIPDQWGQQVLKVTLAVQRVSKVPKATTAQPGPQGPVEGLKFQAGLTLADQTTTSGRRPERSELATISENTTTELLALFIVCCS